jgi:dTDP-4-dehydrorhamnose 3,5-epimerase
MKFSETIIQGSYVISPEKVEDGRGFFARTFCQREFAAHCLDQDLVQCSISFNRQRGTLRGMHYQSAPYAETKLVRCTRGAIYDVILDLRPQSSTFGRWVATTLSDDNRLTLYIPEGVAHGFQTLCAESEILYQISEFYAPEHTHGVRWNDPAFAIEWPISNPIISARDLSYPVFAR